MFDHIINLPIQEIILFTFLVILVSAIVYVVLEKTIGRFAKHESYRNEIEPMVNKLVNIAGPKLAGTIGFTRSEVEEIIGQDKNFDAEAYYEFKKQVSDGTLSKEKLMKQLA